MKIDLVKTFTVYVKMSVRKCYANLTHWSHIINKIQLLVVLLSEVTWSKVMIVVIFLLLLKHKRTEGRPGLDKQGSQSGGRVVINAKL